MATKDKNRTSDRYKRTRRALKDAKNRDKIAETTSSGTKVTWNHDESTTDEIFRELDVTELRWPDENVRDSSQDLAAIEPLAIKRHNGPSCSNKLVVGKLKCGHAVTYADRSRGVKRTCQICCQGQHTQTSHEDSNEFPNMFSRLSDEIILTIFKMLPRQTLIICARVCKYWLSLVFDESLWCSVHMSKTTFHGGLLGRILLRGTKVMRLASSRVKAPLLDDSLSLYVIPGVVPSSPSNMSCNESLFKLRYLDATLCCFEDNTLLTLLMHTRRLRCLSLDSSALSLGILRALGDCHELEILNLAMCTGITLQGIKALVNGCKRLTHLNLAWTLLSKDSILQVVQDLPNLRQLNLSGSRETMTDEAVFNLIRNCPYLTHLDLSDCILITTISLMAIIQQTDLRHLALSRCYSIPPQAFSFCSEMKTLAKLDVFGLLNEEGVALLRKDLPNVIINGCLFSTIARPVDSKYRGTIWGIRCRR